MASRVTRLSIAFLIVTSILVVTRSLWPSGTERTRTDPARESRRPNVVVIVTDDQRHDTIAYMPRTKRFLHRRATRFTNAFSTTPVCCPSRASTLTGRYAHNHEVLTASTHHRAMAELAEPSMLQETLHEAGYATALYGKFLNNWDVERDPQNLTDWAIFANSAPDGYRNGLWNVNGTVRRIPRYSTSYLRGKAQEFVHRQESKDDQPWFMYIATAAPHAPFVPEAKFRRARVPSGLMTPGMTESDRADKPAWVRTSQTTPAKALSLRRAQIRTLYSVDFLFARLIKTLRQLEEDRQTLLVFTSDNGYLWGEHGLGAKRWPYLESAKVPLYLYWPGRILAGTDHRLVANIDVAPTIVDAVGLSLAPIDGYSLLSNRSRSRLLLEYFASETVAVPPSWASTITSNYQYIEYYDDAGTTIEREYYDLRADRWQLTNLFGDSIVGNDLGAAELQRLKDQLQSDRDCVGSNCP